MSRSAKSVWESIGGPKITCSIILRIFFVVLIIQLDDSFAHRNWKPKFRPHDDHHHPGPWSGPRKHPLDTHPVSDDYSKSSALKYRNLNVEISIENKEHRIKKTNSRLEEDLIDKAVNDGLFLTPDELDARRKAGDNSDPVSRILGGGKDKDVYKPKVPEHCKNDLICEEDMSYPASDMKEIVKGLGGLRVLATVDELPINDRIFDKDSDNLCKSTVATWRPLSVRKSKSEEWHRVVNVNTFEQGITVAHCVKADHACGDEFGISVAGQNAICKQQYSLRPMVVINPDNGTGIANLFPVPSGCCCHSARSKSLSRILQLDEKYPNNGGKNGRK